MRYLSFSHTGSHCCIASLTVFPCLLWLSFKVIQKSQEENYPISSWISRSSFKDGSRSSGRCIVQSIPCPHGSLTILIQSPGPLQTFDRRLMRSYVWLYFVLGIFMPLTLLAVGNCGLMRAVRRSTRTRRQFHVRHTHIDANDRITTVLATVVFTLFQGHIRSCKCNDLASYPGHTKTYWLRSY